MLNSWLFMISLCFEIFLLSSLSTMGGGGSIVFSLDAAPSQESVGVKA